MEVINEDSRNDHTKRTDELLKRSRALIDQCRAINVRFEGLEEETKLMLDGKIKENPSLPDPASDNTDM